MSQTPPRPLPAGRHFKRRRFGVQPPGPAPRPVNPSRQERSQPAPAVVDTAAADAPTLDQQQFKRRVALVIVVLVVLAVPVLLAALILAG